MWDWRSGVGGRETCWELSPWTSWEWIRASTQLVLVEEGRVGERDLSGGYETRELMECGGQMWGRESLEWLPDSWWHRAGPCGAPGHKAFLCPHFFDYLHSASMTFPVFQWADSSSCSLGKGGDARPGRNKQSREKIVQPWGKVLVPHQQIHTISLSCFADTGSLYRWEKLTINDGMLPTSM